MVLPLVRLSLFNEVYRVRLLVGLAAVKEFGLYDDVALPSSWHGKWP